jgi:hypothetical protein
VALGDIGHERADQLFLRLLRGRLVACAAHALIVDADDTAAQQRWLTSRNYAP